MNLYSGRFKGRAVSAELNWDPYNAGYFADPYPVFRRLREETPVYYNAEHDFYAVSRYEDIVQGMLDVRTFSSSRGDVLEFVKVGQPMPPGPAYASHASRTSRSAPCRP
jgi:cytochrome P450